MKRIFPSLCLAGAAVPAISAAAAPDGVVIDPAYEVREIARGEKQPVLSPAAIAIDEAGRIFVAEANRLRRGVCDNRNRDFWFLEDIAAQSTADRLAMYQRWEEKLGKGYFNEFTDRVRLHTDTTGDGVPDQHTPFAEGFNGMLDGLASGVFAFEGAVYFANIPTIWMLRDADGDGIAEQRQSVADGFGVRVSFSGHDMNGFTLGPDGRLYGSIGDRGLSLTTREGKKYHLPDQGSVFRFDPDGSNFEVIHTGLRNPKEIAFDALGNAFSVDNNSDQGDAARIVYLTEGADSGWRMGHQTMHSFHSRIDLQNRPPNRWMDEKMWHERNPDQPLFILPPIAQLTSGPSGLTVHPGTGFAESELGRFLICDYRGNPAQSGVRSFALAADGAGFKMTDARWLIQGACATDVEYTWDGKILISDFIGGWQSHEDGRLLVMENTKPPALPAGIESPGVLIKQGFANRTADELLSLLEHPDMRIRLRAQIAITRLDNALATFHHGFSAERGFSTRLHSVWGLGILARRGSAVPAPFPDAPITPNESLRNAASAALLSLLDDGNPEIRAQAWRALAESPLDGNTLPIAAALTDASPRVRYFATMAAAKRKATQQFDAVCDMLVANDDADLYLRHAGIMALTALATDQPARIAKLAEKPSTALHIAAVVALRRLGAHEITAFLNNRDPRIAAEAIRAICDENIAAVRSSVATMLDQSGTTALSSFMQRRLIHNAYRLGGSDNARRLTAVVLNKTAPADVRNEAVRLLENWAKPHVVDQFLGNHSPLAPRPVEDVTGVLQTALADLLDGDTIAADAGLDFLRQYPLQGDTDTIARLATETTHGPATRANALQTLAAKAPAHANTLLPTLATDKADEVALAALGLLATLDAKAALPGLRAAVADDKSPRARAAWAILGTLDAPEADGIVAQSIINLSLSLGATADALERLDAAEKRAAKSPAVAAALKAYRETIAGAADPLAPWLASLHGGDPKLGRAIFNSHPQGECMRCHRANAGHAGGGEAGPNLAGVGARQDRRTLLESLVLPNAKIAPGFGTVSVTLANDGHLAGTYFGGGDAHVDLATPDGAHRVLAKDVKEATFAPSAMPAMGPLLDPRDLRNLVAWLDSLKGREAAPPPGIPTTFPVLDPATVKPAAPAADPEAVRKIGQQQYIMCAACHGQQGEGSAAGPPLAGSEWVQGPAENLIRIQLRGLQGPIKVKGTEYNMVMPPMPFQTDEQIAAVLTHIRSSFGNNAPPVTPADVAKHRPEVGKPMLTAGELIPPK